MYGRLTEKAEKAINFSQESAMQLCHGLGVCGNGYNTTLVRAILQVSQRYNVKTYSETKVWKLCIDTVRIFGLYC